MIKFILDLLYPPLCLHCDAHLEKKAKLFCPTCLSQLVPIEIEGRCPICFGEDVVCKRCMSRSITVKRHAAALPRFGAPFTLCSYLERGNTSFLPAAASLMLLQFSHLDWPMPDLITSLPISLWERCKRGSNMSALLAMQLATLLHCPFDTVFRTRWDKRAFLEHAEIGTRSIVIPRKKIQICDQRILLIALECDDGCFRQAALSLQEAGAVEIYTLGLMLEDSKF